MATRLEHVRSMAQHLFGRVTGDLNQRSVHMHNYTATIGDQHPFARAIKDHGRLAQALLVLTLTLQAGAHAQKTEQASPGEENQYGTEKGKNITVYQLPMRQLR